MIRRIRTRLPTYLSTGLGALVDISNTPWDHARWWLRQNENVVCPGRQYRQILLGELVNADNFSYLTDWINPRRRRMRMAQPICQLVDLPMRFFGPQAHSNR
jgi:hypothetical protein